MVNPKGTYPLDTTFGERIQGNKVEKQVVAEYIVKEFLKDGQSAFISDGSSTFFVGVLLFAKGRDPFCLYTNSIPIAHEFPLWETNNWPKHFNLDLAGGNVNSSLMMTCGPDCEETAKKMASRAQWTILSLRSLLSNQGPAGLEPESLAIKQAVLQTQKRIILVADSDKLNDETAFGPLVYSDTGEWEELLKRETTRIVTTLPPGKTSQDMQELGRKLQLEKRGPTKAEAQDWGWYAKNTWELRQHLEKRFVELLNPQDP